MILKKRKTRFLFSEVEITKHAVLRVREKEKKTTKENVLFVFIFTKQQRKKINDLTKGSQQEGTTFCLSPTKRKRKKEPERKTN